MLVRGLFVLWDALVLGIRALTYSANVQAEAEGERLEGAPLVLTMGGSLLLGVAIFFLLPAGAAHLAGNLLLWPAWATNLFEGSLRLVLLRGGAPRRKPAPMAGLGDQSL